MKIDKKTIIILIVVAVAVYLLWKRSKGSSATVGDNDEGGEPAATTDTLESLIASSGMNIGEAAYVRQFRQLKESDEAAYKRLVNKALGNGYSYEQQLILDAFWTKYYDNATGQLKPSVTESEKNRIWAVMSNVKKGYGTTSLSGLL